MPNLEKGDRVKLSGIKSNPSLNGKKGTVVGHQPNGRAIVALDPPESRLGAFREESLVVDLTVTRQAKAAYREAKKRVDEDGPGGLSGPKVCGNCGCEEGGGVGRQLMACTACHGAWYCSKSCQRSEWPTHKEECEILKLGRRVANMDAEAHKSRGYKVWTIPRYYIALPLELTGYAKEILVDMPAWTYEKNFSNDSKKHGSVSRRKAFEKSVRYFLKTERSGRAQFTLEDIAGFCQDCFLLKQCGYRGIRDVSPKEVFAKEQSAWSQIFTYMDPIPSGWRLRKKHKVGVPENVVAMWDTDIAEFRAFLAEEKGK